MKTATTVARTVTGVMRMLRTLRMNRIGEPPSSAVCGALRGHPCPLSRAPTRTPLAEHRALWDRAGGPALGHSARVRSWTGTRAAGARPASARRHERPQRVVAALGDRRAVGEQQR